MDTQTQIDRLIELAIIQRTELKQLVEQLPQLREHLNSEVEKVFDEVEPQLRVELEEWAEKKASDSTAKLGNALEAKIAQIAADLQVTTQARFDVLKEQERKLEQLRSEARSELSAQVAILPETVKEIVGAELARFPRAGEIDQLRKEFAEPRGLNPRGKWQAGETYNRLDLVTVNGDSFVSNIDGNKERPSRSATNWTLNAARGMGGGSGFTSLNNVLGDPSAGQIVGSEGGQYVRKTLVAGANITINETASTITIIGDEGQISLQDGTAAAPSLFFTSDTDTGLYRPAANTLGISTSGVQRMYVDENGITTVGAGATFDGSVHAANGNANNPSLSFTGDQDTGFFRHQPNEIGIALGGTQYATLTSTTFSITPVVTMASSLRVNDTTDSSSKDTGAIVTEGGLGVEKSASIGGNLTVSGTTASTNDTSGAFQVVGGAGLKSSAYINTNGDTGRALVVGPVAQSGGNLPYASIKTSASFADFALSLENPNTTAGQGLGLRIVAGAAANDFPIVIKNQANSSTLFSVSGTGAGTLSGNLTVSGGTITGGTSGMSLASGGTNQSITLTPSGTGLLRVTCSRATAYSSSLTGDVVIYNPDQTDNGYSSLAFGTRTSAGGVVDTGSAIASITTNHIGASFATQLAFLTRNGSGTLVEAGRFTNGGNLLLKSDGVDSSNGRLQLATHTTSAGGIGFGTDVSLFRSDAGVLRLASTSNYSHEIVNTAGTGSATTAYSNTGGQLYIGIDSSSGSALGGGAYAGVISRSGAYSLVLRTNSTTALTLDSSQNATFAGRVRTTALGIGSAPNSYYTIVGSPTLTGNDNQAFLNASPTFDSGATGQGNVLWLQGKTAAASYTVTALSGIKIESPSLGASSSVTTVYGIRIMNQTGGTTNYAIYTDGGYIRFGSLPTSSAGLPSGTVWNDGGTLKIA